MTTEPASAAVADVTTADAEPFRFFDNREKYLLFVTTTSEKAVVASRIGNELDHLKPPPPALRVFGRPAEPLAIAMNGRIVATSIPFLERGTTVFHTMIPEGALRAGPNEIATFVIDRSGGAVTLVTTRSHQ